MAARVETRQIHECLFNEWSVITYISCSAKGKAKTPLLHAARCIVDKRAAQPSVDSKLGLKGDIMQRDTQNLAAMGRGYRLGRFVYPLLFLLLLALANASGSWVDAAELDETVPGGTIPPGGTLPAPLTPAPGTGLVRVIHLAPFDGVIANTAVDICTQAGAPVVGLTGLVYLEQSGYLTLTPGVYDWKVLKPGCGTTLLDLPDLPAFTLQSGTVLTLLFVGGGSQPFSSVLLVDRSGVQSTLYLPLIAVN